VCIGLVLPGVGEMRVDIFARRSGMLIGQEAIDNQKSLANTAIHTHAPPADDLQPLFGPV